MTDRFCLISTMKNEGPFILEWLAHYKSLGFDDIVVCTNDCEDGTDTIMKCLQDRGLVRHHPTRRWERTSIQRAALKQASRTSQVKDARWVFVCDADEFLTIKIGDGTVRDLVRLSNIEADVISVPWRIFGPNGVRDFVDQPVSRQFTMAETAPAPDNQAGKFVKSLFTGIERFQRIGVHAPIPHEDHADSIVTVLPGGAVYKRGPVRTANQPNFDFAQVNHYALRSVDSFLVKRARGRPNHESHTLGFDYWTRFDRNDVADDAIRRYDATVAEWMARFRAVDELMALHQDAVAWYHRQVAALRADPEWQQTIAMIEERLDPQPVGGATSQKGALDVVTQGEPASDGAG
ncbi:MAG: glycosyltransferase family 2 protein [Paracoccus sp. (in: a-proteobacteria)]|nr:glycosyltransferase family 2 protein [Paracoccus sp. (in: a-proteobacteria)]